MNRKTFDFTKTDNFVLAPGDIYWMKKSGEELLISKKGELLNSILCQKLTQSKHLLQIADEINLDVIFNIEENFKNSKNEFLMSKKNHFRSNIIELLRLEYFESERSQYEFDMMVWRVFSKFSIAEQNELANINTPLFKRSLRVTSSVVIGAYLLGYYDELFLETIFTKTIKQLMKMVNKDTLTDDIKKLEKMRKNFEDCDGFSEEVKALFDPRIINSEIATWEKLLVIFNINYSFEENELHANVLNKINKSKISIEARELKAMKKTMRVASFNMSEMGLA